MSNIQTIQKLYQKFGEKDIPGILEMLTDDVVFEDNAALWIDNKPNVVPFAGRYEGKETIGKFFIKMGETTEITKFEPKRFFEDSSEVIALVNLAGKFKQSELTGESLWVMLWTVDNGKIKALRVCTMPGTL